MQTRPNVADIKTLAERYEIPPEELAEHLQQLEADRGLTVREFQGVKVWLIAETDSWFLRHVREECGVLQAELGEAWDKSPSTICTWEGGKREIPWRYVRELRATLRRVIKQRAEEAA